MLISFFAEVTDMTVARHDLIVLAEEFLNGLGFGRRLYYDEVFNIL